MSNVSNYDFKKIETKWKDYWANDPIAQSKPTGNGKKYYCLDMFPYPSGSGLHVGHWRGYVLSDVYSRIKWLEGYNILHPMGWDAFGLPAENAAIKQGIHPKISTAANIANFKNQLKNIGAIYDWSKEINTTDPEYYKWTQWIFLQMFKAGLAYEGFMPINWCPSCKTGLANEEVIDSKCERCNTQVEQKEIRQWVLKITSYAQKLLDGLNKLNWPEKVKTMQRNWIGKSEGAQIKFVATNPDVNGAKKTLDLEVFTTRPDTIYGVTFLVIAPDHPLLYDLVTEEQRQEINAFEKIYSNMSNIERLENMQQKEGVFTGSYVKHPITQEELPIWVSNYVLKDYGTGIVMAVPAHDERDFEFAKKYDLPIKEVIVIPEEYKDVNGNQKKAYDANGPLINSGKFNVLDAQTTGQKEILKYLEEKEIGIPKVKYKLRDWIFSRQRYWGEPIPLIHCNKCGIVPVPEQDLPITLPEVEKYEPTGTGESPLADIKEWVNTTCPKCHGPAKRETNTMPQWAGSCWYFLRYPNPDLKDKPWSKEDMEYWLPVDLYVGGIEHAILHLLYARFYVKVLHDLGYLPFDEPFKQLFNQGMINKYSEKSGAIEKMSKSKGNVVSPDEIVEKYGSDTLRMYILFMGPPELDVEWQDAGLEGIKRFLNRLWNYLTDPNNILSQDQKEDIKVTRHVVTKRIHRFIKEFQERINLFKPNTAISAFMEFVNQATQENFKISKDSLEKILVILSTMAPFMASELLEKLLNKKIQDCSWPNYNEELAKPSDVTIAVQINGKMRGTIDIPVGTDKEFVETLAKTAVSKWLENKTIIKLIFIPDRIINFIVK